MGAKKIRNYLRQIAFDQREVYAIPAIVTKVSGNTCTVSPLNGAATISNVLLSADDASDIIIYPSLKSVVMVTMLSDSEGFLSAWSKVDKIEINASKTVTIKAKGKLKIDSGAQVEISGSSIKMNSGANGGLVNVLPLTAQLNKIEIDINALKVLLGTLATIGANSPGAPILGAMVAPFAAYAGIPMVPTQAPTITDNKVTH